MGEDGCKHEHRNRVGREHKAQDRCRHAFGNRLSWVEWSYGRVRRVSEQIDEAQDHQYEGATLRPLFLLFLQLELRDLMGLLWD